MRLRHSAHPDGVRGLGNREAKACLMLMTIEDLPVHTTLPIKVMSQSSRGCLLRTILKRTRKPTPEKSIGIKEGRKRKKEKKGSRKNKEKI